MDNDMIVGIVGRGKMGLDLFNFLIEYDYKVISVGRKDDISVFEKLKRTLARKVKHNLLSEKDMSKKLAKVCITTDYSELELCHIVFETVVEDLAVKREVIKRIEAQVSEECLIATNSSSYSADEVFAEAVHKNRCMGVHFFYPVKITSTVEINRLVANEDCSIQKIKNFLTAVDRKILLLSGKGRLILSQILTTVVAVVFKECSDNNCKAAKMDELIKEKFMLFGAFEVIDSTGFKIIERCLVNFMDERHKVIYESLYDKIKELEQFGYYGGVDGKGYLDAEAERILVTSKEEDDYEKALLHVKVVVLNEIAHIYNSHMVKDEYFLQAVQETLGLKRSLKDTYSEVGSENIKRILSAKYQKDKADMFIGERYDVYEK